MAWSGSNVAAESSAIIELLLSNDIAQQRAGFAALKREQVLTEDLVEALAYYRASEGNLSTRTYISGYLLRRFRTQDSTLPAAAIAFLRQDLQQFARQPGLASFLTSLLRHIQETWPVAAELEPELATILASGVDDASKTKIANIFVNDSALTNRHLDLLLQQSRLASNNAATNKHTAMLDTALKHALNHAASPRSAHAAKLGLGGDPSSDKQRSAIVETYLDQFNSSRWSDRNRAVAAMAKFLPDTLVYLEKALQDPHSRVRKTALWAIHSYYTTTSDVTAPARLLPDLIDNLNPYGTQALARLLILHYGDRAQQPLQTATQGKDAWIAAEAEMLLRRLNRQAGRI